MNHHEMQARLDGQMAHLRGDDATSNPFGLGCSLSRAWAKGWREIVDDEPAPRAKTYRRPMPEDFADRAASGISIKDLMIHYRAGPWQVARWIKKVGGKPRAKRVLPPQPAPSDFAVHAVRETVDQLMKRYVVGTEKIARWRRECGLAVVRAMPVPDDFAKSAATMTWGQLEDHYSVSRLTVRKWCRDVGVKPAAAKRSPAIATLGAMGRAKPAPITQHRDTSRAGQAADYLRQFGAVIRCNSAGQYDPKGDHWRRGPSVLCADEIIARATRNGWNPDAWREVQAA